MAIATVIDLVAEVNRLKVLTSAQRTELETVLAPSITEPRPLAAELIKRGWLTPFQVNLIFTGRSQELLLGPYVLMERIGEGGMGQVFKALHTVLRRIDAVKTIRLGQQPRSGDSLPRFLQEAMATGKVDHKHLVAVRTAEAHGDTFFLAMEFLDGLDLGRILATHPQGLPIRQACDYTRQAALGLQHAHEKGLVHRDIKPGNLMVTREGVLKILDLGLACIRTADQTETRLTRPGSMMGTPDYMPPEQFSNAQGVDERSDIYSLGCTFYHLLTGRPPFPEGTIMEKMRRHCDHEPIPIHEKRPEVSPELSAVVHRMIAKAPEVRYQSAGEVVEALAPFCGAATAIPIALPVPEAKPAPLAQAIQAEVPTEHDSAEESIAISPRLVPAPVPTVRQVPSRRTPRNTILAGGGALALLLVLVVVLLNRGKKPPPAPPDDPLTRTTTTTTTKTDDKLTLTVDPAGTGPRTIREALTQAQAGTRIRVKPGVYEEALVLHSAVELIGDGPVDQVILQSATNDPLVMLADGCSVKGMTIRCMTGTENKHHAIDISGKGKILVQGCTVHSNSLTPVLVRGGAELQAILKSCKVVSDTTGGVLVVREASAVLEDCDIQGKTKAGLEAHADARLEARNCRVHDGESYGLLLIDRARGKIESCHFFSNAKSNVCIVDQSKVELTGCQMYSGKTFGVLIDENGGALLRECEIHDNTVAGVKLTKGSNPTLRKCRIRGGETGLFCDKGSEGLFEDCEFLGSTLAEVDIADGANPRLRKCKIHSGKGVGVQSAERGEGWLEECEIYGHKDACVQVAEGARLNLTRCKIHDGQDTGAKVWKKGQLSLDRCDIYGNVKAGVGVGPEGKLMIRGGSVTRNGTIGISVSDMGEADVEGCDLRSNSIKAWAQSPKAVVKQRNNQE